MTMIRRAYFVQGYGVIYILVLEVVGASINAILEAVPTTKVIAYNLCKL
jgi:hypothetical protein